MAPQRSGLAQRADAAEARRDLGRSKSSPSSSPKPLGQTIASEPIRAELVGSDVAFALGVNVQGHAPVLDLCRPLVAAGIEREERRARTALGGSVANLHALIASPRDGWMTWGNEIPRERFEEAAE